MEQNKNVPPKLCFLCNRNLDEKKYNKITRESAIETLIIASTTRQDGKHIELSKMNEVYAHTDCRAKYTLKSELTKVVKELEASRLQKVARPRSNSIDAFDLKNCCLFCEENVTCENYIKKQKKLTVSKRRLVSDVLTTKFKEKILATINTSQDPKHVALKDRIANVDLIAAEAKYHRDCYDTFYKNLVPTRKTMGRPSIQESTSAMDKILHFINENIDESQFLISDLHSLVKEEVNDSRTVLAFLQNHYKDRIVVSNIHRQGLVITFQGKANEILRKEWYNQRKENLRAEKLRIVEMAATIVRDEIKSKAYNTKTYPPTHELLNKVEENIPETLRLFIDVVTKHRSENDNIVNKRLSICHAIIKATRPRSFLSHLQLGLGLFLHRKYSSQKLVNVAAAFGFCANYEEIDMFESTEVFQNQPALINLLEQWKFL